MGTLAGNTIGFKEKKDHISIFKLDIIIINIKKKRDNNFSDSNNNNYKKIKIFKPDKYYDEREKFKF